MSQRVGALHIGGAFSSVELMDCVYNELMVPGDTFILSKGHAGILQYVILDDLGILPPGYLDSYCQSGGAIGVHPDRKTPGIFASTGSLGHGLAIGIGAAMANRMARVYVLCSDGELQEGSVWEAAMVAASFGVGNLTLLIDNNDFESFARCSKSHPALYPIGAKFGAFGWDSCEVDGHDAARIVTAARSATGDTPLAVIGKTIKGKGVGFMEGVPMWHYRSPNVAEYQAALAELGDLRA